LIIFDVKKKDTTFLKNLQELTLQNIKHHSFLGTEMNQNILFLKLVYIFIKIL